MNQPPSMQVQQAMQLQMTFGMAGEFNEKCWNTCYSKNVTREELLKPGGVAVDEVKMKQLQRCQRRCLGRHFEVMRMVIEGRMESDKAMMDQAKAAASGGGGMF